MSVTCTDRVECARLGIIANTTHHTLYLVGTDRWLLAVQTALDAGWFRHRTALGWSKSRAFAHCRAVGRVDLVPATGLQPIDDPYQLSPNLKAVT